jgi:hypothetical protein
MQEQRRRIFDGDRFDTDEDIELEMVEPAEEPEDIDVRSREHDSRWREHFRENDSEV